MTTAITWNIAQLERTTADNIVFTAHYTVDANDGTYFASTYGSIDLEQPSPDNIVPFVELTKNLVVGWVQNKLGGDEKVEAIEAQLQAQLDEQAAPTKAQGVPWS